MIGFVIVFALAAAIAPPQPSSGPLPHVVTERTFTSFIQPVDIRWLDDDDIIVADALRGVSRVSLTKPDASITWLDEWPQPKSPGECYNHLATSNKNVLTADFFFLIQWHPRSADERPQKILFDVINDVDLNGDRILILGSRRDDSGKPADGAIAWLGSLTAPDTLRPILPFRNIYAISDCTLAGLGSARFLKDGSFIVVPGAESGIYLFKADGTLDRVWQSNDLGVEINCEFKQGEGAVIRTQPVARQQWVNRRAMVDEIIDTPGGPALIVRKVSDGVTRWDMLLLNGPSPKAQKLPFTSPSPWAHISAASRGDRIIFLVGDRLENRKDGAPARLILADWKSH